MANRAIWSMLKRHEWLSTPLKKKRIKRAARAIRLVFSPAYRRRRARNHLEFYAEAGAPEGALYIDGQLTAQLEGVRRL